MMDLHSLSLRIDSSGGSGGLAPGPLTATVYDSDGSPYVVTNRVYDPNGNPFLVGASVVDSDGISYVIFT